MATRGVMSLASMVMLVVVAHVLVQTTVAQKVHVVGDGLGWLVPPGGSLAYSTWASLQTFTAGDILVFNFTTGQQDVARVTKENYDLCNFTSPIFLETNGPANFTLNLGGEYYFTSTLDRHCRLGQKLAINVSASSGPAASPTPPTSPPPPRAPVTYTVGDSLGWLVPPGGPIAYATWAFNKTFIVGDSLVFDFVNGTQDVAVVTKTVYETCDTKNTITVLSSSPVNITLTTPGEHYFTSTYPRHCPLGQQLAINVTGAATPPSSSTAPPPSSTSPAAPSPTAGGPITNSASYSSAVGIFYFTFSIFIAFLFN